MEQRLRIGDYELSEEVVASFEKEERHIYIRHTSGEGMSVREADLAEAIGKFYYEHF